MVAIIEFKQQHQEFEKVRLFYLRDLANGYLVAEILSKYYEADVQMHSFDNGISKNAKKNNWDLLQRIFQVGRWLIQKIGISMSSELVVNVCLAKPKFAGILLNTIYMHVAFRSAENQIQLNAGGCKENTKSNVEILFETESKYLEIILKIFGLSNIPENQLRNRSQQVIIRDQISANIEANAKLSIPYILSYLLSNVIHIHIGRTYTKWSS
jgi:hypothetical protein